MMPAGSLAVRFPRLSLSLLAVLFGAISLANAPAASASDVYDGEVYAYDNPADLVDPAADGSRVLRISSGLAVDRVATNTRPVLGQIDDVLRQQLQRTAGFADEGMPIIVDNSLGMNPNLVAKELRAQGYNARSVTEIFGPDPGDLSIGQLADQLGGRVLTVDKTGFPTTGFRIDGRIQSVDSVLRLLQEAGL